MAMPMTVCMMADGVRGRGGEERTGYETGRKSELHVERKEATQIKRMTIVGM